MSDVADVDDALDRLRRGVYGTCGRCAAPVPGERLAAQPTTRTCLACAQAGAAAGSPRVRRT